MDDLLDLCRSERMRRRAAIVWCALFPLVVCLRVYKFRSLPGSLPLLLGDAILLAFLTFSLFLMYRGTTWHARVISGRLLDRLPPEEIVADWQRIQPYRREFLAMLAQWVSYPLQKKENAMLEALETVDLSAGEWQMFTPKARSDDS